jgi:glycine dehydrogenase subunit 1
MSLLGGEGLARLALVNHAKAQTLAARLAQVPGVRVVNESYFNEFAVVLPTDAREVVRALADRGVLGGVSLGRLYPGEAGLHRGLLVTATETTTDEDITALAAALSDVLAGVPA